MCSDENFFDVYFRSSINYFSFVVLVKMGAAVDGISEVRVTRSYPIIFDENLFVSYFWNLVSSERRFISDLILFISFINIFDYSSFFHPEWVIFQSNRKGVGWGVKVIFWHKWWRWVSNGGGFSRDSKLLSGSGSCVSGGIHNKE